MGSLVLQVWFDRYGYGRVARAQLTQMWCLGNPNQSEFVHMYDGICVEKKLLPPRVLGWHRDLEVCSREVIFGFVVARCCSATGTVALF